jgi:hypothetical protein
MFAFEVNFGSWPGPSAPGVRIFFSRFRPPVDHQLFRCHSRIYDTSQASFFRGWGGRGLPGWVCRKIFETFCMAVGKILGLGGSKYRPPPPAGGSAFWPKIGKAVPGPPGTPPRGVVGGWAGRPGPRSAWVEPPPTPGSVKRSLIPASVLCRAMHTQL